MLFPRYIVELELHFFVVDPNPNKCFENKFT